MNPDDRLIRIESALMELQRQVELLNEALVDQQQDLYRIVKQVQKIESVASEWSNSQGDHPSGSAGSGGEVLDDDVEGL